MSFQSGGDMCLGFFQYFWEHGLLPDLPQGARVLEIGCAEADWLKGMRTARKDLYLVGIDQRSTGTRPAADECILGDVLTYEFPEASFDAIIAVSMIEWAGTGKYGDPVDEKGDLHTLQRARRWIKPDGWLYFDVPYSGDHARNPPMRCYEDADFAQLFNQSGWEIVTKQWFEGLMDNGKAHPDGPYMAHLVRPR